MAKLSVALLIIVLVLCGTQCLAKPTALLLLAYDIDIKDVADKFKATEQNPKPKTIPDWMIWADAGKLLELYKTGDLVIKTVYELKAATAKPKVYDDLDEIATVYIRGAKGLCEGLGSKDFVAILNKFAALTQVEVTCCSSGLCTKTACKGCDGSTSLAKSICSGLKADFAGKVTCKGAKGYAVMDMDSTDKNDFQYVISPANGIAASTIQADLLKIDSDTNDSTGKKKLTVSEYLKAEALNQVKENAEGDWDPIAKAFFENKFVVAFYKDFVEKCKAAKPKSILEKNSLEASSFISAYSTTSPMKKFRDLSQQALQPESLD